MKKPYVIHRDIVRGLHEAGVASGDVILVHAAMSALGYVVGGAGVIVAALLEAAGRQGTVVVPTHTPENADPDTFRYPPLPDRARALWTEHYPAFDRQLSTAPRMGAVPEVVRQLPEALRSDHPLFSFAAVGAHARAVTHDHPLHDGMGERSPLARIYELHGKIVLLGVGHDVNTSLHLAEARAGIARRVAQHAAMMVGSTRQWARYEDLDWDNTLFSEIGEALDRSLEAGRAMIGAGTVRVYDQRQTVDFAEVWLRARGAAQAEADDGPVRELVSGSLRLRQPQLADARKVAAQARTLYGHLFNGEQGFMDIDTAQECICESLHAWELGKAFDCLLEERHSGELLALVSARLDDSRIRLAWSELGPNSDAQAIGALLQQWCNELFRAVPHAVRIEALCAPQDTTGARVAQITGMVREGTLRSFVRTLGGLFQDRILFASIRAA